MSAKKNPKLSVKEQVVGVGRVAKITFQASPMAVIVKLIGVAITSTLPLMTVYFAGLTTTALAEAYAGDESAGVRAISLVIITALLGVVQTVWSSIEQYINQMVRYRINSAISDRMYAQFLSLEFWRYDDKRTADLFDKSKQFANFFAYVFDGISSIFTSLVRLIVGLVALSIVSWWLGLILLVAVVPGVVIQFRLSRMQMKHWNEKVETRRVLNVLDWDIMNVNHIAEIRLYGLAKYLLELRAKLRSEDEQERIVFERQFIFKQLGANVIEATAEVLSLAYITTQIIQRAQPVGQLLYVQQIISQTLGSATSLVEQASRLDSDIVNLFSYNEFMELPIPDDKGKRLTNRPDKIALEGVSFRYLASSQLALDNVSLQISQGQRVAIAGENGAGKSTLTKILLGLYTPTEGKVLVDGIDLRELKITDWHEQISVLQQDFAKYIFASAKDNVLMGDVARPADPERLDRAIVDAEAGEFTKKLPKGLDSFVYQWMEHQDGTSGVDLSGGQWQRLALARNFYRDSPIVILDEPTSAIDALAEARIFNRLFTKQDKTIIVVSHRLTTVKKADVIYVMQDGKIVEQGTHGELVDRHGVYFQLFESQM